jgi:hypothetical protein
LILWLVAAKLASPSFGTKTSRQHRQSKLCSYKARTNLKIRFSADVDFHITRDLSDNFIRIIEKLEK